MKLNEYLDEHGTQQTTVARRAGVHHRTVSNILQGKDILLSVALQIEDATKGKVTVYDMAPQKFIERQKNKKVLI